MMYILNIIIFMAAKTQYTKDFKEKVVREYKNGNLSIDDVAAKYGIPAALLQDWVNKDDVENIFASYISAPIKETSIWSLIKANVGLAYQKIKVKGWLVAGCLSFLISLFTFITCNKRVVESIEYDNSKSLTVAVDSLAKIYTNLNKEVKGIRVLLTKINGKLNFNLSPMTTIIYDHRRWNRYKRTNIRYLKKKTHSNMSISNVTNNDSTTINTGRITAGHGRGCCCCQCQNDSVR